MNSTGNTGRYAGALYVATSILGVFAMICVPSKLVVHNDATATAANVLAHETLWRLAIGAQLVGEVGFIFVALALYELLKGVDRRAALWMVILIVVSVPISILNELNSVAALALFRGADYLGVLDKVQRDALGMLFVNLHFRGLGIAQLFWGLWLFPLALLVYRSRFLPRFIGVWLALGGVGNVMLSLADVTFPRLQHIAGVYSQWANLGEIVFMFWLLIRGARPPVQNAEP